MKEDNPASPDVFRPLVLILAALSVSASASNADSPRVLPVGEKPADVRLGDLTNLNGYFPFTPPETTQRWQARSGFLKLQLKVACGLHPMPQQDPRQCRDPRRRRSGRVHSRKGLLRELPRALRDRQPLSA